MRPDTDLVVEKINSRWQVHTMVRVAGTSKVLGRYRLRVTASAVAIALAKHCYRHVNGRRACEVFWRGRNGRIVERNTYGHDPEESRG